MSRGILLGSVLALVASPAVRGEEMSLAGLIEEVRAQERLYEDIEVQLTYQYEVNTAIAWLLPHSARDITRHRRMVLQDGKYYLNAEDQFVPMAGKEVGIRVTAGYDGDKTRRLEGQKQRHRGQDVNIGHIVTGFALDDRVVPPHALLLESAHVTFPLSTLLGGTSALRAEPRAGWFANHTVDIWLEGETEVHGLHCLQVGYSRHPENAAREQGEVHTLWLATERNYFPVRHTATYRSTEPYEVGQCQDFVELAPGRWFPRRLSIVIYDTRSPGTPLLGKHEWRLERAALTPTYDMSLFRNIEFPEGTRVFEKDGGGIVRSFTVPVSSSKANRKVMGLVVASALLLCLVVGILLRRTAVTGLLRRQSE